MRRIPSIIIIVNFDNSIVVFGITIFILKSNWFKSLKTVSYKIKSEFVLFNSIKKAKYRLVLSFSTQRAKKDRYLRQKAFEKLKDKINNNPNLTKSDLRSPYKKYLDLDNNCKVTFKIKKEELKLDEKLDGIKGYITNDFTLSHNEIINHYTNLHFIEEAFKISKTDLQIRPIYHRLENRIKAHILISFVAYAIYRDFTLKIKKNSIKLSKHILKDLIKHIFAIKTDDGLTPLKLSHTQQQIYDALFS